MRSQNARRKRHWILRFAQNDKSLSAMHRPILALFALSALLAASAFAAEPVTLRWLGDAAPAAPNGVTWGVPWPKGAVAPNTRMTLTNERGNRIPVQTWPTAF